MFSCMLARLAGDIVDNEIREAPYHEIIYLTTKLDDLSHCDNTRALSRSKHAHLYPIYCGSTYPIK